MDGGAFVNEAETVEVRSGGKRHATAQLVGILLLVVTFALTATFNALAGALGGRKTN